MMMSGSVVTLELFSRFPHAMKWDLSYQKVTFIGIQKWQWERGRKEEDVEDGWEH